MRRQLLCLLLVWTSFSVANGQQTLTVAQDGSGDFTSIQAAINAAPAGEKTTIHIHEGIYAEQVVIGSKTAPSDKKISLIGDGIDKTVIISKAGMATGLRFDQTPALSVYAEDFYAEGLTLQNTAGRNGGQALALYVAGDRQTYYRCRIAGYQDTHRTKKHTRSFYKDCIIEGAVDYIYAGGTCWFDHCTLHCVGAGYITAPEDIEPYIVSSTGKHIQLGFIFSNCTVTKEEGVADGSIYLGRCWAPGKCGSLFLNCHLGNAIHPAGWAEMGGNTGENSFFGEYNSTDDDGKPVNVTKRISWSRQLDHDSYEQVNTWEKVDKRFCILRGTKPFNPEEVIASHHQTTAHDYAPLEARLLAFPTARGFGKYTRGGRGGKVVEVTNLADSGEGSFRWALQQGNENATIVFRVSGIIELKSDIRAKLKNVTIAGQTAPGTGILYRGAKLNLGGSRNLIIRNLRGRIGMYGENFRQGGSIGIENADTLIIDHCCFGWSAEENMTIYDNHFTTVQWCLVHEGLYNANHHKGARGYGSQWGGSPATFHHNLLAHNMSRSTRINGASNSERDRNVFLEYYNNVNYNWGRTGACYGGENEAGPESSHECNFVGNYYKPGPGSPMTDNVFVNITNNRNRKTSTGPSRWFFSGNVMEGDSIATRDNWKGVKNSTSYTLDSLRSDTLNTRQEKYYWPRGNQYDYADYQTPTESAEEAFEHVLDKVGTINRDEVEKRIIREVAKGEAYYQGNSKKGAGFIDTPLDAEGWVDYEKAEAPADEDHDGMADEWETDNGLDPQNPDDGRLVITREGYTALEVYLNSLMGEITPIEYKVIKSKP